jgi:hypothetical protein
MSDGVGTGAPASADGRVAARLTPWGSAALLALLLCVAFADVVFLGRSLTTTNAIGAPTTMPTGDYGFAGLPATGVTYVDPGASAWQTEPLAVLAGRMIARGEVPLWNPYSACGAPLAANMHSATLSPLRAPMLASSRAVVWDVYILARLLVAGLGALVLAHGHGLSPRASFVSGASFMLTGYLVWYANMPHMDVDLLLPWLLVALRALGERRSYDRFAAATALIALAIVAGMPESTFFAFVLASLYATFLACARGASWRSAARELAVCAGAFVLGHLLSMFQLAIFIEFLREGLTLHGAQTGLRAIAPRTAITLFAPYFYGNLHAGWGGVSPHDYFPYLGVGTGLLAIVGALGARRPAPALFFAVFMGISLLKVYGVPGIQALGYLPVFKLSVFYKYLGPEVALCAAFLAGCGLDRLLARTASCGTIITVGAAIAILVGALAIAHVPEARAAGSARSAATMTALAIASAFVYSVAGAIAVSRSSRAATWTGVIAFLVAVELVANVPRGRPGRDDPYTVPPFVEIVKRDPEVARIIAIDDVLHPNSSAAYEVQDVRDLDAMYVGRYLRLVQALLEPAAHDRFTGTSASNLLMRIRALSLLNVKYVLATEDLSVDRRLSSDEIVAAAHTRSGSPPTISRFTVNRRTRTTVFQHPPSEFEVTTRVSPGSRLQFYPMIDPICWGPAHGDGVDFSLVIETDSSADSVFSAYVDPKTDAAQRDWRLREIDLAPYVGREIRLRFQTSPHASRDYDWAGWSDLAIVSTRTASPLDLISRGREVDVYLNPAVLPRSFVAPAVHVVRDGNAALEALCDPAFDARSQVVLEADEGPVAPPRGTGDPLRSARVREYHSDRVVIDCDADAASHLVLLDTWYPGWVARVNGTWVPIRHANYLFRAVAVPAGQSEVTFTYEPRSFRMGLAVSSGVAVFLVAGALVAALRARRPENQQLGVRP